MILKNLIRLKYNLRWNSIQSYSTIKFKKKILFFGVDSFSLFSLEKLHNSLINNQISKLDVVTSFKAKKNPVKAFSHHQNLEVFDWPDIKNSKIPGDKYDMGLVVSFGHLIPETIIKSFHLGMLNVHASLLPKYRGASPIIYALKNGDTKTGVSIMRIEPGHFDTGDVLACKEVEIHKDMLMPELHDLLGQNGADLLIDVVLNYEESSKRSVIQDSSKVSYAPKIGNEFSKISWNEMDSLSIYNLHRSLYSFKNLTTFFKDEAVKIFELKYDHNQLPEESSRSRKVGSIKYNWRDKSLLVQCVDNKCIEILKLSIGKKKVMSATDFHNGYLKKCSESERFFA